VGGRAERGAEAEEEAWAVTAAPELKAEWSRFARERERMVEEQVIARGVTDPRVIEVMRRLPRHVFVDEALRDRAYGDHPLPIGEGQTISQPFIVGHMSQLLRLGGREKVLEVGTGCGYQAAVLAELAGRNVWVRAGNGTLGWPDQAPFDRILVAAGGPAVPPPLFEQLAEGGRMVIPVGEVANQTLQVVEKVQGTMRVTADAECVFVKLVGKYAWES
jgi:protein-L-isoaspartate(D-aspartate) O-methyltransferase